MLGANIAHHDLPGVHADAHLDIRQAGLPMGGIDVGHPQLHGEGTGDGPFGIVVAAEGGTKQYLQAIAQNLNNRPPVGENDVHHRLQIAIEKGHDRLGFETLGEGRKAAHIRHQNGDLALGPTEL